MRRPSSRKGMTTSTLLAFIIGLIVLVIAVSYAPTIITNISKSLIGASGEQIDKAVDNIELKEDTVSAQITPIDDTTYSKPIEGTCDTKKINPQNYQTYQSVISAAVKKPGKSGKSLEQALEGSEYSAEALLSSLIQQESGGKWDKQALSPCASIGIAQFTAATAIYYDMKVGVNYNQKSNTFTNVEKYREFVNKNNLWQTCDQMCGTRVSPCNKCTPQYCDYTNDDRFDPNKAIPASAMYLADQITLCKKQGKSIAYGVGAYNSGKCTGEANPGYVKAILENWYPAWSACIG